MPIAVSGQRRPVPRGASGPVRPAGVLFGFMPYPSGNRADRRSGASIFRPSSTTSRASHRHQPCWSPRRMARRSFIPASSTPSSFSTTSIPTNARCDAPRPFLLPFAADGAVSVDCPLSSSTMSSQAPCHRAAPRGRVRSGPPWQLRRSPLHTERRQHVRTRSRFLAASASIRVGDLVTGSIVRSGSACDASTRSRLGTRSWSSFSREIRDHSLLGRRRKPRGLRQSWEDHSSRRPCP